MSAPLRQGVVHVLGSLDVGGLERRLLDLSAHVAPRVPQTLVCLSGRAGVLADDFRRAGCTVVPLALGPGFPLAFVRLLLTQRPVAVHSHVATASGIMLLLALVAGVPVRIAHFRSDGDGRSDTPARRLQRAVLRLLIARCATRVVGVSPGALEQGHGHAWARDRRCALLPNGIDLDRFAGVRPAGAREALSLGEGRVVAVVGRGGREKNRGRALAVFEALADLEPDARLLVVGPPGDEVPALADLVSRSRHADRVVMLGAREDIPTLLTAADVLLSTSVREGLPGVALEARAAGAAVVASDLSGARWLADRVRRVSCLGLAEPDRTWALALQAAGRRAPSSARDGREELRAGGLDLQSAVDRHLALWSARD